MTESTNPNDPIEPDPAFTEVVALLREGRVDTDADTPPPSLWASIQTELDLGSMPDAPTDATAGAEVVDLASRRRWGGPAAMITLAAAVILLFAVPIGLALRDDEPVVATAELEPLEGVTASTTGAELVGADGEYALVLERNDEFDLWVDSSHYLEVWLLEVDDDGNVVDLISLGEVDDSGRYVLPDGTDVDRFVVVDVSIEPDDGNPAHSGVSVVRGPLV